MLLQLAYEDQWFIPIAVDARLQEAIEVQLARAVDSSIENELLERLSISITNAIANCLDVDLQQPTARQITYATHIARELSIAVPGEALRYRGAISEFIERFEKSFRASRSRHSGNNLRR